MKFKIGFLLGAAAGAWVANKASELQHGPDARPSMSAGSTADDAADKLKALTGLARERFSGFIEGPIGNAARDRLTDVIGASLSGSRTSANVRGVRESRDEGPIDVKAS